MNKYSLYSNKTNVKAGQIVLAQGVQLPNHEEMTTKVQRRPRPFLILKKLRNGHYLALSITNKFKEFSSQYLIPKDICLETNFLVGNSYASCSSIIEIENNQIIKNSQEIPGKLFNQIVNHTIKTCTLGHYVGSKEHINIIYDMYTKNKRVTLGSVIKVQYYYDYLLAYDETDKEFICLPLHANEEEDTQDVIQVLKRRSYVNYDEKFYVPKNDMIYIERFGTPDMPIIEQIKHPEEALELSMFYLKKDKK